MTARTLIGSVYSYAGGETGDRFFKAERERHFNVRALLWLRPRWFAFSFAAAKEIGKDVPEAAATAGAAARGTRRCAPVKAGKIEWRSSCVSRSGATAGR